MSDRPKLYAIAPPPCHNVPATLRLLADAIERGEHGPVHAVHAVVETRPSVEVQVFACGPSSHADSHLSFARAMRFLESLDDGGA